MRCYFSNLTQHPANKQTHTHKVIFYYSLLLQDFSKYLMLISKKPESCWLAMSPAYKEAPGAGLGAAEGAGTGPERCLSQVSDVSRGQSAQEGSAELPRCRPESSFEGHGGAGQRCSVPRLLRVQGCLLICWAPISLQPTEAAAAAFISELP